MHHNSTLLKFSEIVAMVANMQIMLDFVDVRVEIGVWHIV